MFANAQQSGFISIFYSVGSNPLALWDKQVKNGHIRRVIDDEVKSLVLDIGGTNVATTYITCPIKPRASLGVKLPYLVMVIKNMKKYFSFEIQILDDKDMRRRFRVSNFQSTTKVRPFCTTMPIGLSSGWNQVQFNLADFTKRAYGSTYIEAIRVQIHANVRIRRIYFTDQLHSDEDLPNEFKLFAPGLRDQKAKGKDKKPSKEALAESPVPPIKTESRPDEEMPPPPTPAEESPVTKEEDKEEGQATTEVELAPEGEAPQAEGEAPPTEEGASPTVEALEAEGKVEEGEPPAEGEAQPPGEESAEAPPQEGAEGEAIPAPEGEGEGAPAEGQEAKPEGEEAVPEGEAPAEATDQDAAPTEEGASAEPVTEEGTVEQSETVEETTEVTTEGVSEPPTETEESPSEPATTDNEGEA